MKTYYKLAMPLGWEPLERKLNGQFVAGSMSGSLNPKWKASGEYKRSQDGRVLIRLNGEWRLRSRVIIEKFLGRSLKQTEIIHHVDGNVENDTEQNLKMVSRAEHRRIHPEMNKKPTYTFSPIFLREQLKTKSQNQLAKELKCSAGVIKRNLGEDCRW
jgi:hypothetical protein